jgi:hypothetical protein
MVEAGLAFGDNAVAGLSHATIIAAADRDVCRRYAESRVKIFRHPMDVRDSRHLRDVL